MRRITRHPFLLPYVTLSDRSSLPKLPGVYYAINPWKPWDVLYVGMAGNMKVRWRGKSHHQLNALLDRGPIRLYYRVLRSEKAAERREAHDIKRFNPPLNGRKESTPFSIFAEIEELVTDAFWVFVIGAIVTTLGLIAVEFAKQSTIVGGTHDGKLIHKSRIK